MDNMNYINEVGIAEICHEANRVYQRICPSPGIPVAPTWKKFVACHAQQAEGVLFGVRAALSGATPEKLHKEWCDKKMTEGWTYGSRKDERYKTHPCLVPYSQLNEMDLMRDLLFSGIVTAFIRHYASCPDAKVSG